MRRKRTARLSRVPYKCANLAGISPRIPIQHSFSKGSCKLPSESRSAVSHSAGPRVFPHAHPCYPRKWAPHSETPLKPYPALAHQPGKQQTHNAVILFGYVLSWFALLSGPVPPAVQFLRRFLSRCSSSEQLSPLKRLIPVQLAIVTMSNNPMALEIWLRYHHESLGVNEFHLRLEGCSAADHELLRSSPWNNLVHATFGYVSRVAALRGRAGRWSSIRGAIAA